MKSLRSKKSLRKLERKKLLEKYSGTLEGFEHLQDSWNGELLMKVGLIPSPSSHKKNPNK